ncbi:MAG: D-alanyl-D-alanine dipeptidase [Verrucomicrobia bacterium]|nr:D-alanyl-D-alanine dipeptidase [Verrucomicrobiota bacterium]MDE3047819.1 D-alanyl-D-alanine dipeptidase [Verrucomicrobiota bacterium]
MCALVELIRVSPKIRLDIRYATARNFTGRPVYRSSRCFLLQKTAERLHRVQENLERMGFGLLVYDGYRPHSVQKIFWSLVPDSRFVGDPAIGSPHNRGAAVDLTLDGCQMPTDFDDFSERASHSYQGAPLEALKNRDLLKRAMEAEGFVSLETEWWHYEEPDAKSYPILDVDLPI